MEYLFTLRYRLSPNDDTPEDLIERLGAAGCDDALIGVGQPGRLALEFTRDAASARAAFQSALKDVKRAVPSARLIEAGPDYVGLTEVAELLGMSRQNMRKLMLAHPDSFPLPVHEGKTSIWRLHQVLDWLRTLGRYDVDVSVLEVSRAALEVNVTKDGVRSPQPLVRKLEGLLA